MREGDVIELTPKGMDSLIEVLEGISDKPIRVQLVLACMAKVLIEKLRSDAMSADDRTTALDLIRTRIGELRRELPS